MSSHEPTPRRIRWLPLIWLAAILAVVLYNGWRYCCGQCSLGDFVVIPWTGWLLVAANLAAGGFLLVLHRLNLQRQSRSACSHCRARLDAHWEFCPQCGAPHART